MGWFQGTKVCNLIGLYTLSETYLITGLSKIFKDDGLAFIKKSSRTTLEKNKIKIPYKKMSSLGNEITTDIVNTNKHFSRCLLRPFSKHKLLLPLT